MTFRHRYRRLHRLYDEIEAVEKPVVLAAQDPGLGLARSWPAEHRSTFE